MSKSTPIKNLVQSNVVYYLLWTHEDQQKNLENNDYGRKRYNKLVRILDVVSKKENPKTILFHIAPFHLDRLDDNQMKDTKLVLPKTGRVYEIDITAYCVQQQNFICSRDRGEYYQLFIIPTEMQKAFEVHILKEHPDCILT